MRYAQARPARANPSDSSAALPPLPLCGVAAVRTPQWSESGTEWRDLKTFVYTLFIRAFALGTGKYAIAKTDRM